MNNVAEIQKHDAGFEGLYGNPIKRINQTTLTASNMEKNYANDLLNTNLSFWTLFLGRLFPKTAKNCKIPT